MARFFIDRPIFAWVIAIIIMLAGALAIHQLPVEQFPNIAPTTVVVGASYPGAAPRAVEESVTQVIEQSLTGIDHLMYISSTSGVRGDASVQLTFEAGTDPDIAQVQVQNKLQQAVRRLPQPVQAQGLTVTKSTNGFLRVYAFYATDGRLSREDIGDYINSALVDPVSRVPGVGQAALFGSGYAMRIWLDPYKLNRYRLVPGDISAALQAQNTQVAAGQLGGLPATAGQQLNALVTAQSRLTTAQQFRDVVLHVNTDGSLLRLGDVARVELGAESYDNTVLYNGHPAVALAISLASGANAVKTADAVNARLAELARFMPAGVTYKVGYDPTAFVRASIREVIKTLFEAIALVVLIMFVFLQNARATLVPAIAVPVVLLGTFGVLALLGYSINTLTMYALVLSIGLLVDDAIVVVENVERLMREEGLDAREATRRSMDQITGALFGIALVLSAVLVPMAFFGGSTGMIYRQFSVTIVAAMALSVLVAMTLSPALCAAVLRPVPPAGHRLAWLAWFENGYDALSRRYRSVVEGILPRVRHGMFVYVGLVIAMVVLVLRMPTSFMPDEDQGAIVALAQLPPGATLERTRQVIGQFSARLAETEARGVQAVFSVSGRAFQVYGQNMGMSFTLLKDWSQRTSRDLSAQAIAARVSHLAGEQRDARIFATLPPMIFGLGNGSGFDFELKDVGGVGRDQLVAARERFMGLAARDPRLTHVRQNSAAEAPEYHLEVDPQKASALGLSIATINDTLSAAMGGSYVNDFVDRGRVKKVYMQADAPFRMQPEDVGRWFVRNANGGMVPIAAFTTGSWTVSAPTLERYNGASAVEIVGEPVAGTSTGTALEAIEGIMKQMPEGIGFEWSGVSFQEKLSGAQAPALYAISVLFVFLCLAALYESWALPFAVMLVVPLGIIGALLAAFLRGLPEDVYFQVGLLTTVGLSAKNAILITEFARNLHLGGMDAMAAVREAVRIRLRPIVMTSLSFMLGVLPLVLASGAGSGGRIAIGTGVFGGMLAATLLGVLFVPLFFLFVQGIVVRLQARRAAAGAAPPA